MSFNAYKSFLGPIELPIEGRNGTKTYTIPPVPAELGLELQLIAEKSSEIMRIAIENDEARQAAETAGEPAPEPTPLPDFELDHVDSREDITRRLLGPIYDEMRADGVPYEALVQAGQTATHDFLYGREAAEAYWNTGGDPKAVAETLPQANIFSRSTDAENTTPTPDSTSGTKPQTKKSKN